METLPEVIVTSGANSTAVYDASNGSSLLVLNKMDKIAPKTLALVGGDYFIGGIMSEPRMKVLTVPKMESPELATFTCRGEVNALAVTSCGTYCVAAIKEEIHIWRVSSGELLNVLSRHYQGITCLKFSTDDSQFLSGGKDGHVLVWILSQSISIDREREDLNPRFVWNHHSTEVTDIFTGSLGCVARVATTSLDMMCKIYELDSGILLATIYMDVPLTSVVMDTLEYYVFLGADNGSIFRINTYESLPKEMHFNDTKKIQFKAHEQKVTCLSFSLDGEKLLSASDDNTCRLWDVASMACLLTLSMDGITNAFLAVKPACLCSEDMKPQLIIRHFKREFENKNGMRVLIDSNPVSRPTTLKKIIHFDEDYSLNAIASQTTLKKHEEAHFEDVFQQTIHGGTVDELQDVNKQLYVQLIDKELDNLSYDLRGDEAMQEGNSH